MTDRPEFVGIDGKKRKVTSKNWDVVVGDGYKPLPNEQVLPFEEEEEVRTCADFHICRHADD